MTYPRNERHAHAEMLRASQTRHQSHDWIAEREGFMSRFIEFAHVFWHYSKYHGVAYAARRAYGIAIKGLPF